MSEARSGRFEIDLEEIEKQLRRSAEAAPPPKNDPLAELARIVGQDDPFRGLFADQKMRASPSSAVSGPRPVEERHVLGHGDAGARYGAELAAADAVELTERRREESAVLHDVRSGDEVFDPVSDAYGSLDNVLEDDDFRPLAPRRSRKRLLAVGGLLVVAVVGTAGGLAYRNGGKFALNSGAPPIIQADNAPLKVAPQNPGGMEIPNQDRQIYERGTPEAKTRVVDAREQPIDVREASRNLPSTAASPDPAAPASAQGAKPAAAPTVTASIPSSVSAPQPSGAGRPAGPAAEAARSARSSAVTSALGEPRRVRTVSVRPDGTLFDAPPAPSLSNPAPAFVPAAGSLPPPVQVATIPISLTPSGTPAQVASTATSAPPSGPEAAPETGLGAPTGPVVAVLPPLRPRGLTPPATRVAAIPAEAGTEAAAAGATGAFTVQLGVRPTEAEARTTATQLATRYAGDLGGRVPAVARAEVNGKTLYRLRVGPMPKEDATSLCTRLKSAGGQCFVAQN